MKNIYIIAMIALVVSCASPKRDDYVKHQTNSKQISQINKQNITIILEPTSGLDFRGIYESDRSIDSPQMLYYGVGDLVGHAIAISNMKEEKLKAQQAKADSTLDPIRSILISQIHDDLITNAEGYTFNGEAKYLVHSKPIFFFSNDLKSLSIKHVISIENPEIKSKKKRTVYQNIVEVLSAPIDSATPSEILLADNGAYVYEAAKTLYQDSLDIAFNNLNLTNGPMRQVNHKFYQGNKERFERGEILKESCEMTVMKNLRGWLIAYPNSAKKTINPTDPNC